MTIPPIFFLHNAKAGGCSIRELLEPLYEPGTVAPRFGDSPAERAMIGTEFEPFAGYEFYSGHYGIDVRERVAPAHRLVVNVRHPVDRIISMYRYWRYDVPAEVIATLAPADAARVLAARDLSLSQFLRSPLPGLAETIYDCQLRQLSGCPYRRVADRDLPFAFATACSQMRQSDWIYLAEDPMGSMRLLGEWLPALRGATLRRVNVSGGPRPVLSMEDRNHILEHNLYDMALYQLACAIHADRLDALDRREMRAAQPYRVAA